MLFFRFQEPQSSVRLNHMLIVSRETININLGGDLDCLRSQTIQLRSNTYFRCSVHFQAPCGSNVKLSYFLYDGLLRGKI